MSGFRSKKPRQGRPRILGPSMLPVQAPLLETPPSLPPAAPETALTPPLKKKHKRPVPCWKLPDDSHVRRCALQIMAMRLAGWEDVDIAAALKISPKSVRPYVYRAGKNGWLNLDNAKERIEYQLMHKVVRNLDEALDSKGVLNTGMSERTAVALKVAEGTVFKEFGEQAVAPVQQTMVAVRIIMPAGPVQQMRDDMAGGQPAYIDADVQSIKDE